MSVATQTSSATFMIGAIWVCLVVVVAGIRYLVNEVSTLLLGIL
jgi:hypothetical protein